jgi:hypothetical protein
MSPYCAQQPAPAAPRVPRRGRPPKVAPKAVEDAGSEEFLYDLSAVVLHHGTNIDQGALYPPATPQSSSLFRFPITQSHIHTNAHTHMHARIHTQVSGHTYTYTRTHVHIHIHTLAPRAHISIQIHLPTCSPPQDTTRRSAGTKRHSRGSTSMT